MVLVQDTLYHHAIQIYEVSSKYISNCFLERIQFCDRQTDGHIGKTICIQTLRWRDKMNTDKTALLESFSFALMLYIPVNNISAISGIFPLFLS